jgi:integrase
VITVHGTRKTCGSRLAALDVHPRVAMQILRHSKIAVTMEIYTEVPRSLPVMLGKLGQWLAWPLLPFAAAAGPEEAGPMVGTGR